MSVSPGVVTSGETVQLLVELPEVDGSAPTSVVLQGVGIETLSSETAAAAPADESRWSVRARIEAPAGPLPIEIRVAYPGGDSFTIASTLTVVPGESSGGFSWVAVTIGTAIASALALAALVVARRRA